MEEKKHLRFLRQLQKLAKKKGISLEELIQKAKLGELTLKLWEEAGKVKRPKKVLRADIAALAKEVRRLRGNLR